GSIPGYAAAPHLGRFRAVVRAAGCAIVGAGPDLAPAERRLYAIRDVTATVDSLSLITASVLAKKLAAGLDALVMDVKVGSGALLPLHDSAAGPASSPLALSRAAGVGRPPPPSHHHPAPPPPR